MAFISAKSFDNGNLIVSMLGYFWDNLFTDQEGLRKYANALGVMFYDAYNRTREVIKSTNLETAVVLDYSYYYLK